MIRLVVTAVLFCALANAQQGLETLALQHAVNGQTIAWAQELQATLEFGKEFKYVGGQRFTLYGVADAEQHFFAETAQDGTVKKFYWIQFEHYLPSNSHKYDYKAERTTEIGGLRFIHDSAGFSDYSVATGNPDSDGAKARGLFAKKGLSFPKKMARIRLVHLPGADLRSELMIIYGESLAADSKVPVSEDGTALDEQSPESAKMILQHATEGLTITRNTR